MTEQTTDPLITWLRQLEQQNDRGAMAVLRRSLAFDPGKYSPAYPYVERFVGKGGDWQKIVAYLVAGLYASSRASAGEGSLGKAAAMLRNRSNSASVEKRFIALLDADPEQLPNRLRQMITLMSAHEIAPDWSRLRRDLHYWRDPERRVQQRWAADYYIDDAINRTEQTNPDAGADAVETDN